MSGSPLEEVLRDAALVLAREGVPYALIGGVGAIFYGSTRATRDVDLSIDSSPEALSGVCRSLEAAGFSEVEVRDAVVQARHRNGYRLDLLVAQSSFEREVIAGASTQELPGGHCTRVARLEDIVAFKVVGGRPRDLRDIEELLEANPHPELVRLCHLLGLVGVSVTPADWQDAAARDEIRPLVKRLSSSARSPC